MNTEEWGGEAAAAEEKAMAVEGGEMRFGRIVVEEGSLGRKMVVGDHGRCEREELEEDWEGQNRP